MCDDKRTRIMQAVEQLLTERRWHQITTDDVAAVAKVGKGTLYKYFRDKDDLFFQTAIAGFDQLCELLSRHLRSSEPFEQQLMAAAGQIGDFFAHRRQVFRMMQTEDGGQAWCRPEMKAEWHARRQVLLTVLARVIQRGIDEGVVRRDVSAMALAAYFLGMVRTRARDLADRPEEERSNRLIVDLFIRGLGSPTMSMPSGGADSSRGEAAAFSETVVSAT
jgi:AcrR family transcriptional regulator